MRFWDSSAILSLCVEEAGSQETSVLAQEDPSLAVWWGTLVECYSGMARWRREGTVDASGEEGVRTTIETLAHEWLEIRPGEEVRRGALEVLRLYPLRSADALQLGAARLWAGGRPGGQPFVSLDSRLREAALRDGFAVLPP